MAHSCRRPSPREAYAQWMDACASAGWRGGLEAEQVTVRDALGRVTAEPVRARWASPRAACAAMDGIAIAAAAVEGPGRVDLPASAVTWIDTGDRLPPGADAVVQRERVEVRADGGVGFAGPVTQGLNVRAAGEDFQQGQALTPAGRRLRPGDLGAAAAAGHVTLPVARRPVVAIIPTGDEIRPVGSVLRPGDIIDSNSVMLAARAEQAGAVPVVSDVQPDDPDTLAAHVRRAALGADLMLVIAGSSRGRDDYTSAVIAQVGGLAVAGVAVRPGHPALLGHVKEDYVKRVDVKQGDVKQGDVQQGSLGPGHAGIVPVIGVPGYPLAAAVICELFALPLLRALLGEQDTEEMPVRARLACDWASSPDVEDWIPVALAPSSPGVMEATPARHGSGSTSQLARAQGWWRVPIGHGRFRQGDLIDVRPMR